MPTFAFTNFNIVCATFGGFVAAFGLVSCLLKETFYIAEPLVSLCAGIIFSPLGLNWIRPEHYALGSPQNLDTITLVFCRLVLGIQLVITGIELPARYIHLEWKSLVYLLGPGMTLMWLCSGLLIWLLMPNLSFISALVAGACITPTDPVLSYSIVKGKYADKNVPKALRELIVAESGANDGLGYPFLFFALYLLKFRGSDGSLYDALSMLFTETFMYMIVFSVICGAVLGWLAREVSRFTDRKGLVEHDSLKFTGIALALFIIGTCGALGTDDILACFVAGCFFNWDGWFSQKARDEIVQAIVDKLLNIAIFVWFGAVCPWHLFISNEEISFERLFTLGFLILLLRRLPMLLLAWRLLPMIENWQQAAFVGFFGPTGVSAIFYLYIALASLAEMNPSSTSGSLQDHLGMLQETIRVVVWFVVICSVIVHGISVPILKLTDSLYSRLQGRDRIRLE